MTTNLINTNCEGKLTYYEHQDYNHLILLKTGADTVSVVDRCYFDKIKQFTWHVNKHTGYISHTLQESSKKLIKDKIPDHGHRLYLHTFIMIMCVGKDKPSSKHSVDHINRNKFDNRVENLRWSTASEQIVNRNTRNDKKTPPQELIDIGVHELVKHVRYDNSQKRFVIEKCSYTDYVSENGTRKGTVYQQYRDVLETGLKYDKLLNTNNMESLKGLFEDLYTETRILMLYEELEERNIFQTHLNILLHQANIHGIETKLKKDNFPDGVHFDLPKYTYYSPAKGNKGDSFTIERHPNMEKRQWRTTGSVQVSTKIKYEQLMQKYSELS